MSKLVRWHIFSSSQQRQRGELRGQSLLLAPAELQTEEQAGGPGQGSPQPALASLPASISLAPPGSCSHRAPSPAGQSQPSTSAWVGEPCPVREPQSGQLEVEDRLLRSYSPEASRGVQQGGAGGSARETGIFFKENTLKTQVFCREGVKGVKGPTTGQVFAPPG